MTTEFSYWIELKCKGCDIIFNFFYKASPKLLENTIPDLDSHSPYFVGSEQVTGSKKHPFQYTCLSFPSEICLHFLKIEMNQRLKNKLTKSKIHLLKNSNNPIVTICLSLCTKTKYNNLTDTCII